MDMDSNEQQRIIKYLDGEMDDVEIGMFKNDLNTNNNLKKSFESLNIARLTVQMAGLQQTVARVMSHEKKRGINSPSQKHIRTGQLIKFVLAAAACAALVVIGVNRYKETQLTPASLYNEAYTPFDASGSRGAGDIGDSVTIAFREKKFDKVITLYQQVKNPTATAKIIAGSAYLQLSDLQNAESTFSSLINQGLTNTSPYRDDAKYYLALTLLKENSFERAAGLMEEIRRNPANPYSVKFTIDFIGRVKQLK